MIAANSTDGPIEALGLTVLEDDRHYFPPYQAVPLIRAEALERWPQIANALADLAGISARRRMRAMNEQWMAIIAILPRWCENFGGEGL